MRYLLLALFLLAGCGPNLDVDPLLILGTGETEFVPLTAGVDDLVLASGVQGGQHVWGAVRATGVDWTNLTITWELTDEDEEEVTETTTIRQSLNHCTRSDDACEGGMGEIVAVTVIIDDVSGVRGDELTMTVRASDEDGREATATSKIRPITVIDYE
jgi:hypothetical protein